MIGVGPGVHLPPTPPSTGGGTDWLAVILVLAVPTYILLQSRASRRTTWRSRWESVAPLLWVVWSDVAYVATFPIRVTRGSTASRHTGVSLTAEERMALEEMEKELGPYDA